VLENNEVIHTSRRAIHNPQMDAADIYKALGYVMTDPEWKELVFIAARRVLYRRSFGRSNVALRPYPESESVTVRADRRIRLGIDSVVRRAGLDRGRVDELLASAERV